MSDPIQILSLLADGRFHSGEDLAGKLAVSRAAVWKKLNQIKERFGLELHSVRGRGYRLAYPIELLDHRAIQAQLTEAGKRQIQAIEIFDQIDSTNSYLMKLASDTDVSGRICLAEQQTSGRGRRGRQWASPFGSNIYLSTLWQYSVGMSALSGISLAAGVVIARVLDRLGVEGIGLKWPNDLLVDEKKLAGILLEVSGEQDGPASVVLGVGLNMNMPPNGGAEIEQPWIDLRSLLGPERVPSRNALGARLIDAIVQMMSGYESDGLAAYREDWQRFDLYLNKPVTVRMSDEKAFSGLHRGIDDSGALLLQMGDEIRPFYGGEVSLRPV